MKHLDRFISLFRMNTDDDDYDDYDDDGEDYDEIEDEYDDYDDIPAPVVKETHTNKNESSNETKYKDSDDKSKKSKKSFFKSKEDRSQREYSSDLVETQPKIVPMRSSNSRNSKGEVCVLRPTVYEDTQAICDVLLSGKAAVINLEGIDTETAQRIVDFICGACYAMKGHIETISNFIFIITPNSIKISGDTQEYISSGLNFSNFGDGF